ncbi:MAG: ATP-dependent RecD-like DNA helicase [Lachnospiraceae bacterium]|jgi:exodeoxyribonuclease V alpha subunit|nr:ATP-dependent RecD-like DNA helicase [Lachnospiraceae bacterium]
MSEQITGYIEKIVYRNTDNAYTVLSLSTNEEEIACVGYFSSVSEGEYLEAEGVRTAHPVYGEQFQVKRYEIREPEDAVAMERYLGSGAIKGIGPALAARIIKKFGEDTFRIIEEEPECLSKVKGISERKAREIAEQFEEKRELRGAMLFLQKYGISNNLAVKIYKQYGARMYEVMRQNPYRLAEEVHGIGFKLADEIAGKLGIGQDSEYRLKAGLLYVLQRAAGNGHTYLLRKDLEQQAKELLGVPIEELEQLLTDLVMERRIVRKRLPATGEKTQSAEEETQPEVLEAIYHSSFYYMELNVARMLCDLNVTCEVEEDRLLRRVAEIEEESGLELEVMQRQAVMESVKNGLLIISGGPGTGKTTTINSIIRLFEAEQMEILLAAPTGRAAKRMQEATKHDAQTIHRLLELTGSPEAIAEQKEQNRMNFERNEMNPLEADVIMIDEMSMVDITLMYALLKAIPVGTRLILAGDVNQLPSVGPGNVLRDMIESHAFQVVMLNKIFRQAAESDIIVNAHKIHRGEQLVLNNQSKDFFLLKRSDTLLIQRVILSLVQEKMPKYVNADVFDIQVLTPMRKGELGVEHLNRLLQKYLNPPAPDKQEREVGDGLFREGDKVMQIRNNYQLAWEIRSPHGTVIESGMGIFNGDAGVVRQINSFAETMTVEFEEGKQVEYPFSQLDELELAYAITIHKSQGSEYPAVVLPILSGPRMLFNRNLLYTAVTRAKQCVTIVGSETMVQHMIENVSEMKRYSGLAGCIREML